MGDHDEQLRDCENGGVDLLPEAREHLAGDGALVGACEEEDQDDLVGTR